MMRAGQGVGGKRNTCLISPPPAAQRDAPSTRAVALEHVKPQLARFRRMHRQRALLHVAQHVPPHTPTTMLPRAVNANAKPAGSAAIQRTAARAWGTFIPLAARTGKIIPHNQGAAAACARRDLPARSCTG